MEYKVFRFNDFDWVAGTNFNEALDWYMKTTGLEKDEALDPSYEPYENMPSHVIIDRYGNEDLEDEYLEDEDDNTMYVPADVVLKREQLKDGSPFIFCSTEW